MTTKKCSKVYGCGQEKLLPSFILYKNGNYGNVCRDCRNKKTRSRRNKDKEKTNEINRKYRKNNPEKCNAYCKKSYNKNKHKYSDHRQKYRNDHKNEAKLYNIKYKQENAEKIQQYEQSDHRKELQRKYHYKYEKNKLANDVEYRLEKNIRARFRTAFVNEYKTGSAINDLGCSIKDFKVWIEEQFYPHPITGEMMTWENYGKKWHLDHYFPLSMYDLTDREQFLEAVYYINLQPMWAEENLRKHDKIPNDTW